MPARILHSEAGWQAEINGTCHPAHPDPVHAEGVSRIWHSATAIAEHEYRWLVAVREAAEVADPDHPALHPTKPIDPMRLKPLQPRTPQR